MVMKMTAMESLRDPKMIYLDVAAGIGGLVLFNLIENGRASFDVSKINWKLAATVLVSRLVIDFSYATLVSEKTHFGGSNQEFLLSSVMWFFLLSMSALKTDQVVSLYISSVLVMFAVARATHWG